MMMNSCLTIIAGGSASGKSVISKKLILNNNFVQYKPFTTRAIRTDEIDLDYKHICVEEFEHLIKQDKFIFWDYLFNNYYGVGKDINSFINATENSLIILPAWRVKEFLAIINVEPLIFHLITEPSLAKPRLAKRNASHAEDRISDLINQNNVCLDSMRNRNYYKVDSKDFSEENIYELIISKIMFYKDNKITSDQITKNFEILFQK